jgi:hypothetical protein
MQAKPEKNLDPYESKAMNCHASKNYASKNHGFFNAFQAN